MAPYQNIAFTAQYELDPGEEVLHGTLALALRQTGGLLDTDFIRLFTPNSTCNFFLIDDLDWDVIGSETFVGVLDLSPFLSELQGGEINVQLNNNVAVDWALLQLRGGRKSDPTSSVTIPEPTTTAFLMLGFTWFSINAKYLRGSSRQHRQ